MVLAKLSPSTQRSLTFPRITIIDSNGDLSSWLFTPKNQKEVDELVNHIHEDPQLLLVNKLSRACMKAMKESVLAKADAYFHETTVEQLRNMAKKKLIKRQESEPMLLAIRF